MNPASTAIWGRNAGETLATRAKSWSPSSAPPSFAAIWSLPLPSEHASYIASWLKVLKSDSRAIFSAAAHAQRAADYLNGFSKTADLSEAA